jgi:hypothetical protein
MSNRKNALMQLLAKVEAGSSIWPAELDGTGLSDRPFGDAYNGSMDAAHALHEAVLPKHRARIDVGKKYRAWVITPDNKKFDAYSINPARAWLIAILKALILIENTKDEETK